MPSPALLRPDEYVWLPALHGGCAEPPPAGADGIRAVLFRRSPGAGTSARTVVLETDRGEVPLPRRIRLHGDADEGWDWAWRGSAPLETALNLLACFVHPRAAWRLQWAFCETFLHPLPVVGGRLHGAELRTWITGHAWVGRQGAWEAVAEAERRAPLEREREESRRLAPGARAARAARLVLPALSWDRAAAREADAELHAFAHRLWGAEALGGGADAPGSAEFQLARAAAVLAGAPPPERWETLAALAAHLPPRGSAKDRDWELAASPCTPGLPDPETTRVVAGLWERLGGRSAAGRAAVVAGEIRLRAERDGAGSWERFPEIALPLGARLEEARRGEPHLAGDPAACAATLHALAAALERDPALAAAAGRLGLELAGIDERLRAAHEIHAGWLGEERRRAEAAAAARAECVRAAEAARLPRGRSPRPAPVSAALHAWLLAAPEEELSGLARMAAGRSGPPRVRQALRGHGLAVPDAPEALARAVAWYLEERAPRVLDLPSFPVRGDGLFLTPPAPHR